MSSWFSSDRSLPVLSQLSISTQEAGHFLYGNWPQWQQLREIHFSYSVHIKGNAHYRNNCQRELNRILLDELASYNNSHTVRCCNNLVNFLKSIHKRHPIAHPLGWDKMADMFADGIFKCISLSQNCCILIKISLKYGHKVSIDNNPALVHIIVWHRTGDMPLSEPMMA